LLIVFKCDGIGTFSLLGEFYLTIGFGGFIICKAILPFPLVFDVMRGVAGLGAY